MIALLIFVMEGTDGAGKFVGRTREKYANTCARKLMYLIQGDSLCAEASSSSFSSFFACQVQ